MKTSNPNRFAAKIGRVASLLVFAAALGVLGSCSTSKKITKAEVSESMGVGTAGSKHHSKSKVVNEAYTWIGTPYKYACAEKGVGTDCSGLVMKVYQEAEGWQLPRNSAKQAEYCEPVKEGNVKEGDLVFFATGRNPEVVSHVGIMVDPANFIHASSSKGVVVTKLASPYFKTRFLMFGRVPQAAASR